MNVICFGDSNTYGYDPRSYLGGRYPADCRWVDLLAAKTGWNIQNDGINGRQIPRQAIVVPEETHLLIVMLGVNDLLQGLSPDTVTSHMEAFLNGLEQKNILLIAPPPMCLGAWVTNPDFIKASIQLAENYQSLASRLGIHFANAGKWNITMTFDGVHFTQEGHKAFAEGLQKELIKEIRSNL